MRSPGEGSPWIWNGRQLGGLQFLLVMFRGAFGGDYITTHLSGASPIPSHAVTASCPAFVCQKSKKNKGAMEKS